MKEIIFEKITKIYDKNVVLDRLNLKVEEGERLILLGPSGCGKSTTLRIIAGLESITEGNLIMGGRVVNEEPGSLRNIAMVFQNYALYPHMTVEENICYGLKIQKVPLEERKKRQKEVLEILSLEGLEKRKPRELSGGQRQRVALARAIVKHADYFLLDEPLSNLDAQLRLQARQELVRLHEKFNMTFVYVTHDQVEAMTMGQRIVLLNKGKIQMVAKPKEIYDHPANVFTARFIGSPSMNILPFEMREGEIYMEKSNTKITPDNRLRQLLGSGDHTKGYLGIRPEVISVGSAPGEETLEVTINYCEDYGHKVGLYFSLGQKECIAIVPETNLRAGDRAFIALPKEKIQLFDYDTEDNLEKANDLC